MKKIFVFGTRGFPNIQGGVEKHCEHLYPFISKYYEISVFRRTPFLNKNNTVYENINFIDLPTTKKKGFEAFFHSFLSAIYTIIKRPDLIHIHNIGPGMFVPLLKLFRLKVVLTYHSSNYEHDKWNKTEKNILKFAENISLRFADKIIFVNEMQMHKSSKKIIKKAVFIPNGITINPLITTPDYISQLGLEPYKYILAVGRITKEKGFDYLIEAYNLLSKKDIKLVIAGGVDHKSKYSDFYLNKKNENIIFTGFVEGEKLQELYSLSKLFIIPSYNEGHPLVLIEAISYCRPILASDIPANLQLKLPEDKYFKVGSIESLKNKMEIELTKPELHIDYHIKLNTWEDIANQTIKVYRDILNK